MTFLFTIEAVFEITGRSGVIVVPAKDEGPDFRIRTGDDIQLRPPGGQILNTRIGSIELLKLATGACRLAIFLASNVQKADVPVETQVFLIESQRAG